jgi:hypothetical protein
MVATLLLKLERSVFTVATVLLKLLVVAGATTAAAATAFTGAGVAARVTNPLEGSARSSSFSILAQRRWQLNV